MVADPRRFGPRVPVESFCSELHGDQLRHALVVDLSEDGLCIQRPIGGPRTRSLQLEIEIPGVDEIGWASAEVCFDEIRRAQGGGRGIVRTSGLRLLSVAQRHRRILREYVNDTFVSVLSGSGGCYPDASAPRSPAPPLALDRQRELRRETDMSDYLQGAACYLRG